MTEKDKEHEGTFAEGEAEKHPEDSAHMGDYAVGQEKPEDEHEEEREHPGSFAEGQSEDQHGGHSGGNFAEGQVEEEDDAH